MELSGWEKKERIKGKISGSLFVIFVPMTLSSILGSNASRSVGSRAPRSLVRSSSSGQERQEAKYEPVLFRLVTFKISESMLSVCLFEPWQGWDYTSRSSINKLNAI